MRKFPEFGVKQREERAMRELERLGLIDLSSTAAPSLEAGGCRAQPERDYNKGRVLVRSNGP